MTDREKLTEMLTRAGFEVKPGMWNACDDGCETIGIDTEDGSVGFSFDLAGNLKGVWGRDW